MLSPVCLLLHSNPFLPCTQVVQTIGAQFGQDAAGSAQGMSTADFFVTGPSCPQAPAEFVAGSDAVPTLGGSTTAPTSGGSSSGTDSSSSGTSGSSTGSAGAVEQPALDDGATAAPPAGLSVVLSGVQSQKSATPAWQLSVEPADNATLTAGQAGSVSFKVSWSKTKPVSQIGRQESVVGGQCLSQIRRAVVQSAPEHPRAFNCPAVLQPPCNTPLTHKVHTAACSSPGPERDARRHKMKQLHDLLHAVLCAANGLSRSAYVHG